LCANVPLLANLQVTLVALLLLGAVKQKDALQQEEDDWAIPFARVGG
jgi:hypothetical protein